MKAQLERLQHPTTRQFAHALDVALRRRAELAAVLAVELRDTFVAHARGGAAGVQRLRQHELARLLQAQLLLVLQRAHAREAAEVQAEGRGAHVRALGQLVHQHVMAEVRS